MFPDRTNKLIQKRNFLDSCVFQEKLKNYKLVCMLAKLHLTLLPVKIRDKDAIMCRSWDFCYYTLKLTNPKNTVKTFQHRDGNINSVWLNVSKAQKLIEISNILCNTISKDVVAIILDFSCWISIYIYIKKANVCVNFRSDDRFFAVNCRSGNRWWYSKNSKCNICNFNSDFTYLGTGSPTTTKICNF